MFRQMNVRRILITALRFINQLSHTTHHTYNNNQKKTRTFFRLNTLAVNSETLRMFFICMTQRTILYFFLTTFVFAMKFMKKYAYFSEKYPDLFSEKIPIVFEGISRFLSEKYSNFFEKNSPDSNRLQKNPQTQTTYIQIISDLVRQVEYIFNECFKYQRKHIKAMLKLCLDKHPTMFLLSDVCVCLCISLCVSKWTRLFFKCQPKKMKMKSKITSFHFLGSLNSVLKLRNTCVPFFFVHALKVEKQRDRNLEKRREKK